MRITNKLESVNKIIELDLNRFQEKIFKKGQEKEVADFIDKNRAHYYAIRNKEIIGYKTKIKVPFDKVMEEIKKYNLFSIHISSYEYTNNLILIGEIKIDNFNNVWLYASKTDYPYKYTNEDPEYNLCTDIYDKKLNHVEGFNTIYKYILDNKLLNVIIEFAVYNIPIGLKKEKVIIFEIRTDF